MKRPSFQFYPFDWQGNSNLRRCSHEEKGIWIDVMCVLHDQDDYGICRWTLKEIAQAVGCQLPKLKGLVSKGILKGADNNETCDALVYTPRSGRKSGPEVTLIAQQKGPLWYSSRMVVDEYKRVIRAESGATPKDAPDLSPKGGIGAAPKGAPHPSPSRARASSTSTSTATPKEDNSIELSTSGKKIPDSHPDDIRLAEFILAGVMDAVPKTKPPSIERWANTIRLMRERDHLSLREIAEVFTWANRNSFWRLNILSPETLREKFPKLSAQKEQDHANSQHTDRPDHGRDDSTVGRASAVAKQRREEILARIGANGTGDGGALGQDGPPVRGEVVAAVR